MHDLNLDTMFHYKIPEIANTIKLPIKYRIKTRKFYIFE